MAQAASTAAAPPAAPAFAMAPEWVVASCVGQLRQLYHTTTLPFAEPFADYTAALQRARELEVGHGHASGCGMQAAHCVVCNVSCTCVGTAPQQGMMLVVWCGGLGVGG